MKLAERVLKEINDFGLCEANIKTDNIKLFDDVMLYMKENGHRSPFEGRTVDFFKEQFPKYKNEDKKVSKVWKELQQARVATNSDIKRTFMDLQRRAKDNLLDFQDSPLLLKYKSAKMERIDWNVYEAQVVYTIDFPYWMNNRLTKGAFDIVIDMLFKISMKKDDVLLSKVNVKVEGTNRSKLDDDKLNKFINHHIVRNLPLRKPLSGRTFQQSVRIPFDIDVSSNAR